MKDTERRTWYGITIIALCAVLAGFWIGVLAMPSEHIYTAETFTPDLTIRIQCSGDCDLAAMIAEAREAVEK